VPLPFNQDVVTGSNPVRPTLCFLFLWLTSASLTLFNLVKSFLKVLIVAYSPWGTIRLYRVHRYLFSKFEYLRYNDYVECFGICILTSC